MILLTFAHVMMKTLASSLILCVNISWLAIYMAFDALLFVFIKLVRRDLTYWIKLPPYVSASFSFWIRVTQKVLIDYTLTLHMRYSMEIGGILFSFLVIQNQVWSFVAVHLYSRHYSGSNLIEASQLEAMLFALLGSFLVSLLAFVLLMDRKYLGTFVATTTGPQSAVNRFHVATTDEQRVSIMKYHHYYYAGVEVELKALIAENWEEWMLNRPEWLTESVIATIPDKFLLTKEVVRLSKLGDGLKRRRNSASDIFNGAVERK
jgi:hypothetical protein